jgi:hypothetical protein
MKLGVVGSRNFTDQDLLSSVLLGFYLFSEDERRIFMFLDSTIVSGGAEGADAMAAKLARDEHVPLIEHLPDLATYGSPVAYFKRNSLIVDDADILFAFFGPGEPPSVNKSGTMDTVRKAIAKRIPVHLYFQQEG